VLPPEEQAKVDRATLKAVEFLKKQQQPDGSWPRGPRVGYTALAGLTLLETGVPARDPAMVKAAQVVRDGTQNFNKRYETYELSLAILFLNRLGDRADRDLIQRLALRLVAGQSVQGGWTYGCPLLSKENHDRLLAVLTDLKTKTGAELLRDPKGPAATLRAQVPQLGPLIADQPPPGNNYHGGGDNSNTQFAILALWAARSHDLPLDPTLARINKRFRATQGADGRWFYGGPGQEVSTPVPGKGPLPTMTCAGLLGVAVGFGLQDRDRKAGRPDEDPIVKKGLEHLAKFIGEPSPRARDGKPAARLPMQQLYFLWSVERVAMLYQLKTVLGKKWYEWGMETLLANQRPDGSWVGGGHGSTDIVDTCLAILFLQRVNLAKDLTDKLLERAVGAAAPPPGGPPPAKKE
jgi:hypothetical protein